jgi:UDP-2-acetamido-3-amino-2,3-dideoxy-glucuronate N-acetyltransferase
MAVHATARIHSLALVDDCEIGAETRVWAFSHVLSGARIGARCNLGEGVFVEGGAVIGDDCTIKNSIAVWDGVVLGDRVFVGPHAVFTNVDRPRAGRRVERSSYLPTFIGEGASIGANATIRCGVTIGRSAFIGAGSVVLRDVPAYALVVGNPARQRGWVCECAARLDPEFSCPDCSSRYKLGPKGLFAFSSGDVDRSR